MSDSDLPPVFVDIHGASVRVDVPHGFLGAVDSPLFHDWIDSLDPRLVVTSIKIQSIDWIGGLVGFIKLKADMTLDGKPIPGVVFLRGNSVAIFVELVVGARSYALMTVQPRPATGELLVEIPAGMVDGNGDIRCKAIDELEQEAGIRIDPEALIDLDALTQRDDESSTMSEGIFASPGACDEAINYFWLRVEMDEDQIKALKGKATGVLKEGEQIVLKVVPFRELSRLRDGKLFTALGLIASVLLKMGWHPVEELSKADPLLR